MRTAQQQQDHGFDCHICFELLVDPVVGRCGHDFCMSCVQRWMQQQSGHDQLGVRCPVCRGAFAESPSKLKVCIRLKTLVETMFPGDVAARRAVLSQQAAATAVAGRVQAALPSAQAVDRHVQGPAASATHAGTQAPAVRAQTSAQTPARAAAIAREAQERQAALGLQAHRFVEQSAAADARQARQRAAMAAAPQHTATASAQLLQAPAPASQAASNPWQAFAIAGAGTPAFGAPPPAWHSAHALAAAPTRLRPHDSGVPAPPALLHSTAPRRPAAQPAAAPAASMLRAWPEFARQPPVPPPALTSQAASMFAASRRRPAQPAAVPERARQPVPVPPPALNAQAANMSSALAAAGVTIVRKQQQ